MTVPCISWELPSRDYFRAEAGVKSEGGIKRLNRQDAKVRKRRNYDLNSNPGSSFQPWRLRVLAVQSNFFQFSSKVDFTGWLFYSIWQQRAISSVGQSARITPVRSQVRALYRPLIHFRRVSHHPALRRYSLQSLSLEISRPNAVRRLATPSVQILGWGLLGPIGVRPPPHPSPWEQGEEENSFAENVTHTSPHTHFG